VRVIDVNARQNDPPPLPTIQRPPPGPQFPMPDSTAQVPEALMQQLHQATDRFHAARQELERWMEASEYRHQERISAAAQGLREAEREVEEIEQRISELLHKSG
jgi:hypothetical protein